MKGTGIYLRLSQDDGGEQSQSIQNQRILLMEYCAGHGIDSVSEYVDDGFSGTSFDRPAFRRLIADVEAGAIGTVITKDLSRLGRDYILTGWYLERWFPEHGVRYISVSDGIDSSLPSGAMRMAPFLAVFNDMYAQDISLKVRAALGAKKNSGIFIGSSPPYGYMRSPSDGGRLIPDPACADTVREIFRLFLRTASLSAVADTLTARGEATPAMRKGLKNASPVWNRETLRRILTNPTYAGHLTQNRSRKLNHKSGKKISLPQSQWITVRGTHAPLVSQSDFDAAGRLISLRPVRSAVPPHRLSGLVFCGGCGGVMTFMHSGGHTYLVCSASRAPGKKKHCSPHLIREDRLEQALAQTLSDLCRPLFTDAELDALAMPRQTRHGEPDKSRRSAEINKTKERLEDFLRFENSTRAQLAALTDRITVTDSGHVHVSLRAAPPHSVSTSAV